MMNNDNNNNVTEQSGNKPVSSDTSTEETLKRGKAAIRARLTVDNRPEEIKQQEEKDDAEKWRNEG